MGDPSSTKVAGPRHTLSRSGSDAIIVVLATGRAEMAAPEPTRHRRVIGRITLMRPLPGKPGKPACVARSRIW
jgi:hypothetical protein